MLENVKGIVSKHRAAFNGMLQPLWQIGNGAYQVGYTSIDTARHGIPQHRDRVYIVGLLRDYIVPGCFKWPEPRTSRGLPEVLGWRIHGNRRSALVKAHRTYNALCARASPKVRMRLRLTLKQ
ncbi:MAG: DNA cytosine methyltransferase, partial [Candidatus Fonsibacter sp.]